MIFTEPPDDPSLREGWFYMWIGLCLTRWGFVHEGLYEICFSALDTTAQNTAIIFYRTPNFDARLSLTNEVVEAHFPPLKPGEHEERETVKEWRAIYKALLDLVPVRNALAHQKPTSTGEPIQVMTRDGPQFVGLNTSFGLAREWMEVKLSHSEELRGRNVKVKSVRDTELPVHYAALQGVMDRLFMFNRTFRWQQKYEAKSVP